MGTAASPAPIGDAMQPERRVPSWLFGLLALLPLAPAARADDLPEYRLKAAFLYNFTLFTEWPPEVGTPLNVCIYGPDPFGKDIDELQGKAVGARSIAVQRKAVGESLGGCQVVYVAPQALGGLIRVLNSVNGRPVLTVASALCRWIG